jgi:hypothetical protein
MNSIDFKDFYIRYQGHPKYKSGQLIEDDIINVIIQKYEMVLFTNKGEVLGEPDLGADLVLLLYETRVSASFVEEIIRQQISTFIPELDSMNYGLKVVFAQDVENYQDMMFIYFQIADYEVYAEVGTRYGGGF